MVAMEGMFCTRMFILIVGLEGTAPSTMDERLFTLFLVKGGLLGDSDMEHIELPLLLLKGLGGGVLLLNITSGITGQADILALLLKRFKLQVALI